MIRFGFFFLTLTLGWSQAKPEDMVFVKGGNYAPLYSSEQNFVQVNDFYMDVYPVTNSQFIDFLKANPEWKKEKVKRLFAEESYLSKLDFDAAKANAKIPVTNVSWFAAMAYCKSQNKRLPTLDEWEYVALASQTEADARKTPSFNQFILDWYERPKNGSPQIGSTYKNFWGVYDLHGLIWEWTLDFNSVLMSGESRKDGSTDRNLFCGSASIGAADLMNYAAFIRYAFRGSLKARYCVQNLGFRCVKDP